MIVYAWNQCRYDMELLRSAFNKLYFDFSLLYFQQCCLRVFE